MKADAADAVGCLHNEVIINADAANMVNTLFDGFRQVSAHGDWASQHDVA